MVAMPDPIPAKTFSVPTNKEDCTVSFQSISTLSQPESIQLVVIVPSILPLKPMVKGVHILNARLPITAELIAAPSAAIKAYPPAPAPKAQKPPETAPPIYPAVKLPPLASFTYPLMIELAPEPIKTPPNTPPTPVAHRTIPATTAAQLSVHASHLGRCPDGSVQLTGSLWQ